MKQTIQMIVMAITTGILYMAASLVFNVWGYENERFY